MKKSFIKRSASLLLASACVASTLAFVQIPGNDVKASVLDRNVIRNEVLTIKDDQSKKVYGAKDLDLKKFPKIETSTKSTKYYWEDYKNSDRKMSWTPSLSDGCYIAKKEYDIVDDDKTLNTVDIWGFLERNDNGAVHGRGGGGPGGAAEDDPEG